MDLHKLRFLIILGIGVLWANMTHSQESVNTAGGDVISNEGSVSYSIGQVFYTSQENSSATIVQGVQHTYEVTQVGTNETSVNISVSVFPNPSTDYLTLEINDFGIETLSYQLRNMQGMLIKKEQIISQKTIISMEALSPATYILQITNEETNLVNSFKIIKN